jgi:DNA-binding NarL/FixJ family response regulator
VLVLTMLEDDDSVLAAMRAGARGYVVKGAGQEELLAAVRTVAAGGAVFGASVAAGLLQSLTAPPVANPFPELTDREAEVLSLMAEGRDNREIAGALGVSSKTVANHVSRVLAKLQARDRVEAVLRARDRR